MGITHGRLDKELPNLFVDGHPSSFHIINTEKKECLSSRDLFLLLIGVGLLQHLVSGVGHALEKVARVIIWRRELAICFVVVWILHVERC